MEREKLKELLPIMTAYANGEEIEYKAKGDPVDTWHDAPSPFFEDEEKDFRIKPKTIYRAFKDRDECIKEMMKHKIPNLLHVRLGDDIVAISSIVKDGINLFNIFCHFNFQQALEMCTFCDDGAPFGIREE